MSHNLPARRTGAALTPQEMSLARRERNMAREAARREAKRLAKLGAAGAPPVVPGTCEIMDGHQSATSAPPAAYRGESLPARGYWWVRDHWDTGAPWFTSGGMFVAGAGTYLAPLSAGQVGLAGAVAAVAASAMAQLKLKGLQHAADRWWVRVGSAASAGWLALASQIGPLNMWSAGTLAAGTVAGAVKWYRYKKGTGVEAVQIEVVEEPETVPEPEPEPEIDPAEVTREHWMSQWIAVTDQLSECKGSRVADVTQHDVANLTLKVQLVPIRQHSDKVVNAAKAIETGLMTEPDRNGKSRHLRPGALKVVADKDDSTVVHVHIRISNPLAKILQFKEIADLLPRSVNEPFLMGRREDKTWDRQKIAGTHWMIGADTGGGKSNLIHTIMANLAGCDDVVIWGCDMKGGRALGPWLPRMDWLATRLEEIDLQLQSIEQIISYRENLDLDSDRVQVGPEQPALVYILDELAEVTGTRAPGGAERAKRLERITSLGRALGVWVVCATQYCSLDSFQSPTFRQQLTVQYLLSTTTRLAASFVLGDDAWQKIKLSDLAAPGMYYRRVTGETQALAARTPYMTPGDNNDLCIKLARQGARIMPVLDAGSASAAVPEYLSRESRLAPNIVKAFLSGARRKEVPAGGSYRQETLPVGTSEGVPGGGYPGRVEGGTGGASGRGTGGVPEAAVAGGTGGVPEGVYRGGTGGASEGGTGGVPGAAVTGGTGGVPGAAQGGTSAEARATFERIWGRAGDRNVVVPIDMAAARRAAANLDFDAIFGEAEITMARTIMAAGQDGATRQQLMDATGMGHDWVSTRANRLVSEGVLICPRRQGQYAPAGTHVTEAVILAGLKEIEEKLKEARRQARAAMGSVS